MIKRLTKARHPAQARIRAPQKPAAPRRSDRGLPTNSMPRIDPKWAWHYKVLVGLRDRLLQRQDEKLREATEPIERHSMHEADSATDEFDHDLALTLLAADQSALTEIADAIQRIVDGTYGTCQATGVRLPKERLRAIPWCRYGREIEDRLEKRGEVKFPRVPRVYSIGGAEEGFAAAAEPAELPPEPVAGQFKPEDETATTDRNARTGPGSGPNESRPRKIAGHAGKKRQ